MMPSPKVTWQEMKLQQKVNNQLLEVLILTLEPMERKRQKPSR
jgi:hypothetical protein